MGWNHQPDKLEEDPFDFGKLTFQGAIFNFTRHFPQWKWQRSNVLSIRIGLDVPTTVSQRWVTFLKIHPWSHLQAKNPGNVQQYILGVAPSQ